MNAKATKLVVTIVAGFAGGWIGFQARPGIGVWNERLNFFDVITCGMFLKPSVDPSAAHLLITSGWKAMAIGFSIGAVIGAFAVLRPPSNADNRTETRKIKVLFLAANPESPNLSNLKIDEEVRAILQKIRLAEQAPVVLARK